MIAVIGDSTFLHTGMPGLLNLTYHRANVTVLLLDNRATAMTGCQNNPANGRDISRQRVAGPGRLSPNWWRRSACGPSASAAPIPTSCPLS